jgi:hypothetical protein
MLQSEFELSRKLPYTIFENKNGKEYLLNRRYEVIMQRHLNKEPAAIVEETFWINNVVSQKFLYSDNNSAFKNKVTKELCLQALDDFFDNKVFDENRFKYILYTQKDKSTKYVAVNYI